MNTNIRLAVIGGDNRMLSCAKKLSELSYNIILFGYENLDGNLKNIKRTNDLSEAINCSDVIILPLPYADTDGFIKMHYSNKKISVSELLDICTNDKKIIGGCFDETFINRCKSLNIDTVDYYEREELKVLNAIPTAEGAIAIAISETDITVHGCECAVLSFGCVGRATARVLDSLGALVTVFARSATALSKAESLGYKTDHILNISSALKGKQLIFNAIPKKVITENVLKNIDKDAIIIDLASKPGGVDIGEAKKHNIRVISALSLPVKYAPVTAGQYLAKTIDHILKGVD